MRTWNSNLLARTINVRTPTALTVSLRNKQKQPFSRSVVPAEEMKMEGGALEPRGLCRDSERSTCKNSLLLPVNAPAGAKADFRLVRHSGETPAVIL